MRILSSLKRSLVTKAETEDDRRLVVARTNLDSVAPLLLEAESDIPWSAVTNAWAYKQSSWRKRLEHMAVDR